VNADAERADFLLEEGEISLDLVDRVSAAVRRDPMGYGQQ